MTAPDPRVEAAARAEAERRHQVSPADSLEREPAFCPAFVAGATWAALAAADAVTPTQGAAEVLMAHQRQGSHSCLCSDLPLGASFAQHQADMLVAGGLMVTAEHDAQVREPLIALIRELVDPDSCWFDHTGACQAHGARLLEPGETCPMRRAQVIAAHNPQPLSNTAPPQEVVNP